MKSKSTKIKIPQKIEADLIFKSDFRCCICQKQGDHIHHIDGNDNDINNLAFLCFEHHNLATIKGSLSKKLSKETIRKYRNHHYEVIQTQRENAKQKLNNPINSLNEEILLTISKNAIIIIELEKIKEQYYNAKTWDEKLLVVNQLKMFVNHKNARITYEIIDFLSVVASMTRANIPIDIAICIHMMVLNFSLSINEKIDKEKIIEINKRCIHLGANIAYDAFIHLRNLAIAQWGLNTIKYVYQMAKQNNIVELIESVNRSYDDLESTLQRPERTDLGFAIELTKIFRRDLDDSDLRFPILPHKLQKRVEEDEV